MARKQLIKGANAARLEERISRVPDELDSVAGKNIFSALKALEAGEARSAAPPTKAARAKAQSPSAKAPPKPAKAQQKKQLDESSPPPSSKAPAARVSPAAERPSPNPSSSSSPRLRPSDFTPAERKEILLCCLEYRNRLPTYLVSARREVELLDSIIEKCGK